jgi:subtilase family serine protease
VNLSNTRLRLIPILGSLFLLTLLSTPAAAASPTIPKPSATPVLHTSSVNSVAIPLDPSFDPNLVGGVPFCSSGGLGTILCYPPSFLKAAYDFPATTGWGGLDGRGQTIVIVDAFGSPTIQSDLNKFDTTFGLPATAVTILCGPTWTGSPSDNCPVKTISDLTTAPNASPAVCDAPGWAEETTLDVTMAHALAPGAHIVLVVANDCYDNNLYGAEQAVVNQHRYDGSIMSQSFGEPDDLVTCTALDSNLNCVSYDPTLLNLPNGVFQTATKHHWTIIASTGDEGANEQAFYTGSAELIPSFPATNPLVLGAGGTQGSPYGGKFGGPPGTGGTFTCPAFKFCNTGLVIIFGGLHGCTTAARPGEPSSCVPIGYGGESSWNEALVLGLGTTTGGGISTLYSVPSYQQSVAKHTITTLLGVNVKATGRLTPDVSFNSAIYGGVLAWTGFLDDGTGNTCTGTPCAGDWVVFGGTSAASPAWAGIMALVNQAHGSPMGWVNPAIYSIGNSKVFHDITSGNNAICSGECGEDGYVASRGYDLTTGWGTPDVTALIHALATPYWH